MDALEALPAGDVTRLRGRRGEVRYRLRVGNWRAVFTYPEGAGRVIVHRIAHRREVYR